MAVSGAPVRTKLHAQHICDMALEMQAGIRHLKDPWTGASIRIRIGETEHMFCMITALLKNNSSVVNIIATSLQTILPLTREDLHIW